MFKKMISLPAALLLIAATSATAEIKFISPGETPASPLEAADMSALDLAEIYRGLNLLSFIRSRASRGSILNGLARKLADDDIDGEPGITAADRELAASVEISAALARAAQSWAANDLDGDGVVTRDELIIVGRTRVKVSSARLRQNGTITLTDEQRTELALEYVANFLRRDRDGDNAVTYAEATASVDQEKILTRFRAEGGALKPVWDADGNGTITEFELRRAADRLLDLFDTNGDNVVNTDEVKKSKKALLAARYLINDPTRGKRIRCTLPEVPKLAEVVVIQGEAGTAVTNLKFGVPNDPVVRMIEVVVPQGETEIFLIASMRSASVLRIMGPGAGRLKTVVGVAATIALAGGDAKLANTPCHRGFLGIRIVEPGGVTKEFGLATGRDDVRALVADKLGHVNLGTLMNDTTVLFQNDALPNMRGDGQIIIDRFLSFDPGGYQMLDPAQIQATVPASAREIPPLEIGLIVLASQGKIEFVASPETSSPKSPDTITREAPKGQATDDILWQKTPDSDASTHFQLTVVVLRAIDLPAGLTTERGVRIIVPDGVPKPRGLRN